MKNKLIEITKKYHDEFLKKLRSEGKFIEDFDPIQSQMWHY